jgi:hypothetical protein
MKSGARDPRDYLTPEKILAICKSQGYFAVTLRYRDEWLRKRCSKMYRAGLLRCSGAARRGHAIYYVLPKEPSP